MIEGFLVIKSSKSYQMIERITRLMDKYYLDAVLGFLLEGFGDLLTQLLTLPYIYVSAVKIRSVPLTLAVIYNALCDIAMGLIPFYVGDVIDVFNKSFVRNFKLIVGFVEGDKKVISEINRKAVRMAVLIVIAVRNYLFPCVADNKGDDMVLARYCRAVLVKLKIE